MSRRNDDRYKYSAASETPTSLGSDRAQVINPSTERREALAAFHEEKELTAVEGLWNNKKEPVKGLTAVEDFWSNKKEPVKGFPASSDSGGTPEQHLEVQGEDEELQASPVDLEEQDSGASPVERQGEIIQDTEEVSSQPGKIPSDDLEQHLQIEREENLLQEKESSDASLVEAKGQITQDTASLLSRSVSAGEESPNKSNLRPDVVSHGFVNFEQKFDGSRIMSIYESVDESSVTFVFFHPEGMAIFFGVGLPFCTVKLNADLAIEIREVEEGVWQDYWTKEGTKDFSHAMLFDSSHLFNDDPRGALTSQVSHISTEESAELFGVGVQDMDVARENEEDLDLEFQSLPNQDAVTPAWLQQLRDLICQRDGHDETLRTQRSESMQGEDGSAPESDSGSKNDGDKNSGSEVFYSALETGESSESYHPNDRIHQWLQHNPLFEGQTSNQGVLDTDADGDKDSPEQQQLQHRYLQLTVRVYLDPLRYNLYSPPHRRSVRYRRPELVAKAIEVLYPPESEDHDYEDREPMRMSDQQMVPKVTINFMYEVLGQGRCRKRLTTTLKANFHMDSSVEEEEYFGWYHDELKLSLECLVPNAVRRDTRDLGKEVLSEHRISRPHRRRVEENENMIGSTEQGGVKVNSFDGIFGMNCLSASYKRGRRAEKILKKHAEENHEFELTCLKGSNFSITKSELDDQQLAYRASIHPPISYTSIWDQPQRQLAHSSGIMSTIPLKIQGHWTVKESQNHASNYATLCEYDFFCRRYLIRYGRVRTAASKRSMLCFRMGKEVEPGEEKVVLQQKLPKRFIINHSFSHMIIQNLKRPQEYTWDVRIQDHSPVMHLIR